MAYDVDYKTNTSKVTWANPTEQVDVDNLRRTFGIGDDVASLAPEQSLFLTYLSKVAKKPIDETVWKPMEYRNQWQRRNFNAVYTDGSAGANDEEGIKIYTNYNYQGKFKTNETYSPIFIVPGATLRINGKVWKIATNAAILNIKSNGATDAEGLGVTNGSYVNIAKASVTQVEDKSNQYDAANGDADGAVRGQVIGSQWGEGTGAPDGWKDELSSVEFYNQIFKTSVPLMSGSAQATRYRGIADEWRRIYGNHVLSHKMDIENGLLFSYGNYVSADERYTWGMVPFITQYGKNYDLTYAGSGYDDMIDLMADFFEAESGNTGQKLVLTSRKVIAWLSKLGTGANPSFLSNTVGESAYNFNITNSNSKFANTTITSIGTAFGTLNFASHALFRDDMDNKAVMIDLSNVKYRPLVGNGHNRDTFVETNIQGNDIDGRKDQIITEAGLEILLPETHGLITFS